MELLDVTGAGRLRVAVTGYQFPDAEDPAKRYSWHMVEGAADTGVQQWTFRYPALACDESPRVSEWLRHVADRVALPAPATTEPPALHFAEPNMLFSVVTFDAGTALLSVQLSQEFRPPWLGDAWNEFSLHLRVTEEGLRHAAATWDAEIRPFPATPT